MTHQWNYSPSRQEIIISDRAKITSYFKNKVDYYSMKVNIDSKTEIEEICEDWVSVLLESDCFKPFNKFKVTACIKSPPPTLFKHINILPLWKRTLIQNYKNEISGTILLYLLQHKCDIIIASDGSKSERKSIGAWLIADLSGNRSISGSNPDFGSIISMNSYRSEVYGVLSALLFLHKYFRYSMILLIYHVNYFYDNLEVVNKLK